jgi:uncharacterized protein (DUF3084 family)
LLAEFESLNSDYNNLQPNLATLNASYTNLETEYDALNASYSSLITDYDALNTSYNSLNTSSRDFQQNTENELANIKDIVYVFIAFTVILAASLAYVATRKLKTKPEK